MIIKAKSVVGESHDRIEDFYFYDFHDGKLVAAIGDWANNLVGGPYVYRPVLDILGEKKDIGLNGGVIGSIVAREAIRKNPELYGLNLIYKINRELRKVYEELGIKDYEKHRELTFTGYIAHVVVAPEQTIVTAVGDVRVAFDGKIIAGETKNIDIFNAQKRAEYIRQTGDYEGASEHIKPLIIRQFEYQNKPGNEFSYPAIDGTETRPEQGIKTFTSKTPKRILMWTDGYYPPDEYSIDGLERKLKFAYAIDPWRCTWFPEVSNKKDDRTALEIILDGFDKVEILN